MGIVRSEATPSLRMGDIVRVTRTIWTPRYEPGDSGMIVRGPKGIGERLYYLAMMHRDDPPRIVIFAEDELEPDE